MLKKIITITGLLCMGTLVACAGPTETTSTPVDTNIESYAEEAPGEPAYPEVNTPPPPPTMGEPAETIAPRPGGDIVTSGDLNLLQTTAPQPGDTIVVLHTNMGDITLRFFPEETPMAYENFITHARDGYYDGVIFHRVIEGFMIQGGDPEGTGMGGESIWGHGFGQEFSDYLRHFRGALAMAQSAMPDSIGSQFYIVQNTLIDPGMREELEWALGEQDLLLGEDDDGESVYVRDLLDVDMLEAYLRYGGTPFLDWTMNPNGHTVFGQVIEGMDVVDAIAAVDVVADDRPVTEVIVVSTTVTTF